MRGRPPGPSTHPLPRACVWVRVQLLGRVLARVLDAIFRDPAWEVEGLESAQLPWVLVGNGNGGTAAMAMLTSATHLPHASSLAPVIRSGPRWGRAPGGGGGGGVGV